MNDKIKVLILGLGKYGHSFAVSVLPKCNEYAELVAVVDRREESFEGIPENVGCYTDLVTAVDECKPDLVINITPPDAHTSINELLLSKGVSVMCEKPISGKREDAEKIHSIYSEKGGFLMIGENYRYRKVFREAKRILNSGELGNIHHVEAHFRHYHADYTQFYHGQLPHPLLTDVAVHHLDLARYISSQEPVKVYCREYSAPYTWYQHRPATAHIETEMTGGVICNYRGTLASPVTTTDWNGDWEIECDNGVLKIYNGNVKIITDEGEKEYFVHNGDEDSRVQMLEEACMALKEGRKAETDLNDNYKSFMWVQSAIASSESAEWVEIKE